MQEIVKPYYNVGNVCSISIFWNRFVKYTNQYIDSVKAKFARDRDAKETDLIEIQAFIDLLYLAGAYRANRRRLEELWGTEGDGIEKFGLVMSIKRFEFLIRCIHFDDRTSHSQWKEYDRFCPIRELFDCFVHNCQKNYIPGENVTIDEMLPGFCGKCGFRQYIQSKPTKYGIKIFPLVDARMFYTYNMEIYAGRQPEGPYKVSNKPSDVVKRLAEPIFDTVCNITCDNWFSDIDLVNYLKEKKLSYVGTVRKNKKQLPPSFVNVRGRDQYSSLFGFNNGNTSISYIPKKGKNVILISSLCETDAIDQSTGVQKKPEGITFYNITKGGVDTTDQMSATFNVSRNTRRWPMVIFFACLNIACINSQVISIGNGLEALRRRIFLKTLSHQLVIVHLSRRSLNTSGMPTQLQLRLKSFLPQKERETSSSIPPKRRKCGKCMAETGFRRMTNYECHNCHEPICLSHVKPLCQTCYSAADSEGSFFS
ncbi:piggyBac transposable element-derived protein 4-like [Anabrus simplex]|uniref:piggyBac transposable element-derived protein 4-like n=1 Tax=Anabrus simplex TaxID=316456 RepID=UPI0035A2A7A4